MTTHPRHWLDVTLWPLLRLLWEPLSRKQSHWWHWRPYRGDLRGSVLVQGDTSIRPRATFWDSLWQTNFAWQKVVLLQTQYPGSYQVGIYSEEGGRRVLKHICSIVLKDIRCAALVSYHDVSFFALSYPSGNPVPLEIVGYTTKNELDESVVLL